MVTLAVPEAGHARLVRTDRVKLLLVKGKRKKEQNSSF